MKTIVNIFRRLIFIPTWIVCMFVGLVANIVMFLIYNGFYWIITGEFIPDYYSDEIWDFVINIADKVLPKNKE